MQQENRSELVMTIIYYAMLGGIFYFVLRYAVFWLLPFLLGMGISALLRPAVVSLASVLRTGEKLAAGILLFAFYLLVLGIIALFCIILLVQLYELLVQLPQIYTESIAPPIERASQWLFLVSEDFGIDTGESLTLFQDQVALAVRQAALDGSAKLMGFAASFAAKLPGFILTLLFTVVISFLASFEYRTVGVFLCRLIPEAYLHKASGLQRFLRSTVWQYVRAYVILMAVTFVEVLLGLWLLGFDYVLPVAATIALVDLLPFIGSGSVLVPWGVVLLIGGDTAGGVGLILLFGIIAVVRNILEPRVVGAQIGLHPIATITAMYAGLKIAGLGGLLLGPFFVLLALHLSGEKRK